MFRAQKGADFFGKLKVNVPNHALFNRLLGVEGIPVGAAESFQGRGRRGRGPLRRRQHHRPAGIREARLRPALEGISLLMRVSYRGDLPETRPLLQE